MYTEDHWRYETDLIPLAAAGPGVEEDSSVAGVASNGRSSKGPARVRMEFPETWLWSDSVTGYPSGVVLFTMLLSAM